MKIKEAKTEDWAEIRDLYLELLKENPNAFVDEYDEISQKNKDYWVENLGKENGATFVAIDNGKFFGMGRINFYKELPGIPVLHKLGVLNKYRSKGVAKKLVKAREDWALSMRAKKIRLYVIADNKIAIEMAKKNKYKLIEKLKNNAQRKNGDYIDILVMEKDLI